nr:retrovirus-related Pol polyprotein from transposon TNT 1-94 [Tanacetum cinerariifolium]
MARLEFRMFRVDRIDVQGTIRGEQLLLEIEEFKTKLTMQILNSEYFKNKMLLMQAQENIVVLDEEQLLFIVGGQDNTFDDDVDEPPVKDLALNEDHVFQADQCDAFDSNVDEAPTSQTMFMANLSSADPIYDEVGPSYDSDILSEVQDHDNYIDTVEGERGFEERKECYLTEVIPFFKTVKEHFEGIQTALIKEVKEMNEIFEQMEAEVEKNAVDKKCAEVERKNLLIENENLLADCLSNELLYSVMNAVNTVSRFSELHDAYTVE